MLSTEVMKSNLYAVKGKKSVHSCGPFLTKLSAQDVEYRCGVQVWSTRAIPVPSWLLNFPWLLIHPHLGQCNRK